MNKKEAILLTLAFFGAGLIGAATSGYQGAAFLAGLTLVGYVCGKLS